MRSRPGPEMLSLTIGKVDLNDQLDNQQQHGKERDDLNVGVAKARDGKGGGHGGAVIGSVNERLRACSRSNDEQRRRDWFTRRYLSIGSRGGSAENAPTGMQKSEGRGEEKALLEERFSND